MDNQHSKKTLKLTNQNGETEIYKNQENILTGKQFLLLIPLTRFYCEKSNIQKLKNILDGKSKLSLRLVDWFVTNYSKKNLVMYNLKKIIAKYQLKDNFIEDKNKNKNKNKNINIKDKCVLSDVDSGVDVETTEYYSDYFNVFNNYRAQLKSLNKKNFDPFCRRERIKFFHGKTESDYIITTVGQLNFFKWSIENYILEYIEENISEIENDMNYFTYNKFVDEKTKKKPLYDTQIVNIKPKRKYNKKKKTSEKTINEICNTEKQTKKNKDNLLETEESSATIKKNTRRKRKELSVSATKSFVIHNLKSVITFD